MAVLSRWYVIDENDVVLRDYRFSARFVPDASRAQWTFEWDHAVVATGPYPNLSEPMLTYADVVDIRMGPRWGRDRRICSRMLAYAHVCSRMLTYADAC
jgi:hypothetical protein